MNREQMTYLKAHIRALEQQKRSEIYGPSPAMPKSVAAAKRVVDGWATTQRRLAAARAARLDAARATVWKTLLFRDPVDALKALQKFEAFRP